MQEKKGEYLKGSCMGQIRDNERIMIKNGLETRRREVRELKQAGNGSRREERRGEENGGEGEPRRKKPIERGKGQEKRK